MRLYSFEKLNVWQRARELNKNIYYLSSQFPKEEKFGLTSQIRRASISISSNIAEGSSRKSSKKQARYTEIAYGSLLEVLSQVILANNLKYINSEITLEIRELIEKIGNKLNRLKESQINR